MAIHVALLVRHLSWCDTSNTCILPSTDTDINSEIYAVKQGDEIALMLTQ